MKSVEQSTRTSKKPRGDASTTTPASSDQPAVEEFHVDPTVVVDPAASGDDDTTDPTVTLPLSLHAMMESFMTT